MNKKISCREAVDFISKSEEGRLSLAQRLALWRHLAGCSLCRIFSVQNKIMKRAVAYSEGKDLSTTEKEAIIKAVFEAEA